MHRVLTICAALLLAAAGGAQTSQVISPEVRPDGRVTFRLHATNAREAGFLIDFMPARSQQAMTNDGAGLWSATTGPLKPGIYIYNFIVDGLSIADPVNPRLKQRARTSASLLEIKGNPPEIWEARDVPHGTIEINHHRASTLEGEMREVWVYTPPGYEKRRSRSYPVLYLLHGSNDTPQGWTTVGRANFTMDNLLAEKRAREMIIVTPFGHAVPFGSSGEAQRNNAARFEEYFIKEVMPLVESKYRVAKGRENRAIAGFSMGGGHAIQIGLGRPDLFSAVGAFSAAVPRDFERRYASLLDNPDRTNKRLRLLWIGCGREDFLFDASQNLHQLLRERGVNHIYRQTEGGHTFNVWREYFAELAPLLFR